MSSDTGRYVRIDPKDFIGPPFVACPQCQSNELGILSVYDRGYSRRCRSCRFTDRHKLPPIRKKAIYLDQFAISNLMFADPSSEPQPNNPERLLPFWNDVLRKLTELLRLQLIFCPQSAAHDQESALSAHNKALNAMFESLSVGVSFHNFETIRRFQVIQCLRHWLRDESPDWSQFDIRKVVTRDPHVWSDRFHLWVNIPQSSQYISALRGERAAGQEAMKEIFHRWKENPNVSWDRWFEEEASSYGPSMLSAYQQSLVRFAEVKDGVRPLSEDDVFPTMTQVLGFSLLREISQAGIMGDDRWKTLASFLSSSSLWSVPFNRIGASIYASVARKAAHQNKLPTKGFFTDVDVISCLLPYCDAMFLDVECWTYVSELKRSKRLPYDTKVYSLRNKDEFFAYLDDVWAGASESHLAIVRRIYGD